MEPGLGSDASALTSKNIFLKKQERFTVVDDVWARVSASCPGLGRVEHLCEHFLPAFPPLIQRSLPPHVNTMLELIQTHNKQSGAEQGVSCDLDFCVSANALVWNSIYKITRFVN